MELRWIETHDPLYQQELQLRLKLLRLPLGIPRLEPHPDEANHWHLLALEQEVVGCLIVRPEVDHRAKLCQLAVAEAFQHRGIGSKLIRAAHARLRQEGFRQVYMHARHHLVSLYQGLGYSVTSEPFKEVGILHRRMERAL